MTVIYEMPLVRYNANAKDKNTGDCTLRSLSLAYNIPYADVSREQRSKARGSWYSYNTTPVINSFIQKHGFIKNQNGKIWSDISPRITVEEFSEKYSTGTYLILVSDNQINKRTYGDDTNHIIAVIDGNFYDSWDSSNRWVAKYCIIKEGEDEAIKNSGINLLNSEEIITSIRNGIVYYYNKYISSDSSIHVSNIDKINNSIATFNNPYFSRNNALPIRIYKKDNYTYDAECIILTDEYEEAKNSSETRRMINYDIHRSTCNYKFTPKMTKKEVLDWAFERAMYHFKWLNRELKKENKRIESVSNKDSLKSQFPNLPEGYTFTQDRLKILQRLPDEVKQMITNLAKYSNGQWKLTINDTSRNTGFRTFWFHNFKKFKYLYDLYLSDLSDGYTSKTEYDDEWDLGDDY